MWNWQQKKWPNFTYDKQLLAPYEKDFLLKSGEMVGVYKHIPAQQALQLTIDLLSGEGVASAAIEGEVLQRESVQYSLQQNFGLIKNARETHQPKKQRESGMADMLSDVYQNFNRPLTHQMLCTWHQQICGHDDRIKELGKYRTSDEPMQVVSGPVYKPTVHFEAPPSKKMQQEMARFINWFNNASPQGKKPLPALLWAGLTHLYFVSIHPFEDGNGRIARALSEKALAMALGKATVTALSLIIQQRKKDYYRMLGVSNQQLEVTLWLDYFANTVLQAQQKAVDLVTHLVQKSQFFHAYDGQLNKRQKHVLERLFKAGPDGFEGGLSVTNYIAITKTSRATATRDLQDLVEKGALKQKGQLKSTRYYLVLDDHLSV